jgi:hypothetical protein
MNGVEKGTVFQRSGSTQLLYQGAAAKDRSTPTAQGELHIGTLFCSVSMLSILIEGNPSVYFCTTKGQIFFHFILESIMLKILNMYHTFQKRSKKTHSNIQWLQYLSV